MSAPTGLIPENEFKIILANVYGPQLAAVFLTCGIYGISFLQAFLYYMGKSQDPLWLKVLPGWLVILETIHQVLLCVAMYKTFINNFGDQSVVVTVIPENFVASIFQALITFFAQLFFIYRIWRFSQKNWLILLICIPLTTAQLVLTLVDNSLALIHESSYTYLATLGWFVYAAYSVSLFLDTFFVVAMTYLLTHEGKSPFAKTNHIVNRLLILTVNTGLVTMLATLLSIIFLKTSPNQLIYAFFSFCVSPLYCNSVLANLNSRDFIRGRSMKPRGTTDLFSNQASLELSAMQFTPQGRVIGSLGQSTDLGTLTTRGGEKDAKDAVITQEQQEWHQEK